MEAIIRMDVEAAIIYFALAGLWFHQVTGFVWLVRKVLDLMLALRVMSLLKRLIQQHLR
jgi:hypothetical protein